MSEHLKAAGWVEHHERQVAYSERRSAEARTLADRSMAYANLRADRASLRYWQRRLDAIEAPEL